MYIMQSDKDKNQKVQTDRQGRHMYHVARLTGGIRLILPRLIGILFLCKASYYQNRIMTEVACDVCIIKILFSGASKNYQA